VVYENNAIVGHEPDHQTVAGTFEFKSNGKSIAIGFHRATTFPARGERLVLGLAASVGLVQDADLGAATTAADLQQQAAATGKGAGLHARTVCDARKLTHVSYLRRDPLVPELLGIKRVASQSVLTRFFRGSLRRRQPALFPSALALVSGPAAQCQEGYTLDLDSTRLLHKDGHQEGVAGGLHPARHQTLPASAPGGAGGGAAGGATVAAPRQRQLWQQCHRVLSRPVEEPAPADSVARRARRCGLLPARTAGVVGSVEIALRGGGATEPADPKDHPG